MAEKKQKISQGKKVRIEYTVRIDGEIVESTEGKPALYYEQGKQHVLRGLQDKLEGLTEGQEVEFTLTPDQAYGFRDESKVEHMPYSELPPREQMRPDMLLQERQADGSVKVARVVELKENGALVDLNHPRAGKTLNYRVKVLSVMSGPSNDDTFPRMKFTE